MTFNHPAIKQVQTARSPSLHIDQNLTMSISLLEQRLESFLHHILQLHRRSDHSTWIE